MAEIEWCRACGVPAASPGLGTCTACQWPMEPAFAAPTPVGYLFQVPGKLKITKRLGVCVGGTATGGYDLHLAPNEHLDLPVGTPFYNEAGFAELSPAGRLHAALKRREAGTLNGKWDATVLSTVAAEHTKTAATMRLLADEALVAGWVDVFSAIPLTPSEKVWRAAHQAADTRHVPSLFNAMASLPDTGYPTRCDLLWPLIDQLMAAPGEWPALLHRWAGAGVPGAPEALDAVTATDLRRAAQAGSTRLAQLDPSNGAAWVAAVDGIWSGSLKEAPADAGHEVTALALYNSGVAGADITPAFGKVAHLAAPLLDDLVDCGALTKYTDVAPLLDWAPLLARLRPEAMIIPDLERVGHTAELARRYFIFKNDTALAALGTTSPDARRYQALKAARAGKTFDETALSPEHAAILKLATRARQAIVDGTTSSLPAPVLADPTLWPMFANEARGGKLVASQEDAARFAGFEEWSQLQRLVGLLWAADWRGAVALANSLHGRLHEERLADECQNMKAFAHAQLGQMTEALRDLSSALDGEYTENLLINVCLIAADTEPAIAAPYFSRLVNEAPSIELKLTALHRAIQIWNTSDVTTFPPELISSMNMVLGERIPLEQYVELLKMAALVEPEHLRANRLPNLLGEYSAPLLYFQSLARFRVEDSYGYQDRAKDLVKVYKMVGLPPWFATEVDDFRNQIRTPLLDDIGSPVIGVAEAADIIIVGAPALLERLDAFIIPTRAGAHIAESAQKRNDVLTAEAYRKFFFDPLARFHASLATVPENLMEFVCETMCIATFTAAMNYLAVSRKASADEYNTLMARRRWDTQNHVAITGMMRRNLERDVAHIAFADRMLSEMKRLPRKTDPDLNRIKVLEEHVGSYRDETNRLRRQF